MKAAKRYSNRQNKGGLKYLLRIGGVLALSAMFFFSQSPFSLAYEGHIINVTAHICQPAQTRTIGFWKTHPELYEHYLPQTLGNDSIDTIEEADNVFTDAKAKFMDRMLRAQLLAMKFNIAHFGIGYYEVEEGLTLFDIVAEADELLKQCLTPGCPEVKRKVLKEMKDLLVGLNEAHQLRHCQPAAQVEVISPNGGDNHTVNKTYDIEWNIGEINCVADLLADIWYSADGGRAFVKVAGDLENTGVYAWTVPLFIGDYYLPSERGIIKVIVKCSVNPMLTSWDISDDDFEVKMDETLLTADEIDLLKDLGIIEASSTEEELSEEGIAPLLEGILGIEETAPEEPAPEEPVSEETVDTSTTTEAEPEPVPESEEPGSEEPASEETEEEEVVPEEEPSAEEPVLEEAGVGEEEAGEEPSSEEPSGPEGGEETPEEIPEEIPEEETTGGAETEATTTEPEGGLEPEPLPTDLPSEAPAEEGVPTGAEVGEPDPDPEPEPEPSILTEGEESTATTSEEGLIEGPSEEERIKWRRGIKRRRPHCFG